MLLEFIVKCSIIFIERKWRWKRGASRVIEEILMVWQRVISAVSEKIAYGIRRTRSMNFSYRHQCCSPFNDHESTFFISHLRFVCATIFDDDRFSFCCQTPTIVMFSFALNWLKETKKFQTKNIHILPNYKLWIHTNLPFSFSFFQRAKSEEKKLFFVFFRCYFRIWSWSVFFFYFFL